jgi:hypothetical protein
MLFIFCLLLLNLIGSEWIEVKAHNVKTEIRFSPIPDDNTVISTYTVYVLEAEMKHPLSQIDAFKVEIVLESGFSITKVFDHWETETITSPEGDRRLKAVVLKLIMEEWEFWDIEIFKVSAWYRTKIPDERKI